MGTAAWKTKLDIGKGVEFVAVKVMAVTTGLVRLRSKLNCIFRPAFSKAVIGGMAGGREGGEERGREKERERERERERKRNTLSLNSPTAVDIHTWHRRRNRRGHKRRKRRSRSNGRSLR